MKTYLLPISSEDPLIWVVSEQRTALPARRAKEADRLAEGDRVFLYSTRGCFGNPTRDRGRIIGLATVRERASLLNDPIRFGEREFPVEVPLHIELLAPRREGVELASLVPRLHTFPDPGAWSARMRRALVPLDERDAPLLNRELKKVARRYPDELGTYKG